jgi:hypothetical protein
MKRKSRRGEGNVGGPYRHTDHPRPVTRRQFVAQGFAAGAATVIAPTLFGLFANPRAAQAALSPDLETLKASCGFALQGAGKIPFICIDLAGGANMAGSNVLTGGQEGQRDFLSVAGYGRLGLPGDMVPNAPNPASATNDFIENRLGLLFHLDSAFARGILERVSVTTAAAINGAVIPARSENDTGNNPHNPMYGIFQAGADGELARRARSPAAIPWRRPTCSTRPRARPRSTARATSPASWTPASWSACSTRTTRCA